MICIKCKIDKDETEFDFQFKKLNKRRTTCKACRSNYSKIHYKNNTQSYKDRAKLSNPKSADKFRKWKQSLKEKCQHCGENHPAVLEWHHLDPSKKEATLAKVLNRKAYIRESEKCIILCANCHRKEHWKIRNALIAQSEEASHSK